VFYEVRLLRVLGSSLIRCSRKLAQKRVGAFGAPTPLSIASLYLLTDCDRRDHSRVVSGRSGGGVIQGTLHIHSGLTPVEWFPRVSPRTAAEDGVRRELDRAAGLPTIGIARSVTEARVVSSTGGRLPERYRYVVVLACDALGLVSGTGLGNGRKGDGEASKGFFGVRR
jgi:hypothetical protein